MEQKQLPEKFQEFSEARKNGFLRAKAVKDAGGKIAGTFCTYTPNEVFDAAGVYTVSLCGTSDETVAAAEAELPKNLCPLIKSSYGFAVSDKCPYTYFSDLIVGETTCDGKKKMYELLGRLKDVHVMHLPQGIGRPYTAELWRRELEYLKTLLEEKFGAEITDEKLRAACRLRNRLRRAKLELMELQKLCPPPANYTDLYHVIDSANFSFDVEQSIRAIEEMTAEIRAAYEAGQRPVSPHRKRILITGCPSTGVLQKTVGEIEKSGGVVVCMENCNGLKAAIQMVDEQAPDILQAIADRYLEIGCAVMSPDTKRMELLQRLLQEYRIDGVVEIILQACHPYAIERQQVRETVRQMGLPYIAVETDYSQSDAGQLSTRLSAFIEML